LIGHGEVVGYFLVVLLGHLVLPTLASQHNLSAPMVCRGWNLQDRNTMGQEYTQAVRKCSSFFLPNKEKIRVQFFKYVGGNRVRRVDADTTAPFEFSPFLRLLPQGYHYYLRKVRER
jgi:hypothetical protein